MVRYRREEKYSKPRDPEDMLKLAIERESASAAFYKDMLTCHFSDDMKRFIADLKNEEIAHKAKLEKKLGLLHTQGDTS